MNPRLDSLRPYPFEKLRSLAASVSAPQGIAPINLSIGEPKHASPAFIKQALGRALDGLANYPTTAGSDALRAAICAWLKRRFNLANIDAATQVLPVLGTREALFAIAQTVIDASKRGARVICPNPFYQIYEGAALLAGATPYFLNTLPESGFRMPFESVPEDVWRDTQLVYVCTPGNPTGNVMSLDDWRALFALADAYDFVIVSDECYSEIYFDESAPPLGGLQAATLLGRSDFRGLVTMGSLSKRSNVPGLRSGYCAGDAAIIKRFLLYRTYHGSAMNPAVQAASVAAWNDETHVIENRRLYRAKFDRFFALLSNALPLVRPQAAFYYWVRTPEDDVAFALRLIREAYVHVLPGSLLARDADGHNPGRNFVRIALVCTAEETEQAALRIRDVVARLPENARPALAAD